MTIALAVPPPFRRCARVEAVTAFAEWLDGRAGAELGLPVRTVTVELSPKPALSRGAVGRFLVEGYGRRFLTELWVSLAIGQRSDVDWEAQLATLPHELAHVGQWVRRYGERSPWDVVEPDFASGAVGLPSLAAWRFDSEGGGRSSPEAIARRLTPAFLADRDQFRYPVCPASCPCWGRAAPAKAP